MDLDCETIEREAHEIVETVPRHKRREGVAVVVAGLYARVVPARQYRECWSRPPSGAAVRHEVEAAYGEDVAPEVEARVPEPVQVDDDVDLLGHRRHVVPAEDEIRSSASMARQQRDVRHADALRGNCRRRDLA